MSEIPTYEEILERRRDEKAETIRLAKAGVFVHDTQLVEADRVDEYLTQVCGPNWREVL